MAEGLTLPQLAVALTVLGAGAVLFVISRSRTQAQTQAAPVVIEKPAAEPGACEGGFEISLERTVCYGTCPAYRVQVDADGKVAFLGRQFVKVTGPRSWTIGSTAAIELCQDLTGAGFLNLDSNFESGKNCPSVSTDAPSAFLELRAGAKVKRVRHYHGCEGSTTAASLTELENRVDEVLKTSSRVVDRSRR